MSDNSASECFKWLVFQLEKVGTPGQEWQEALDEIEKAITLAENIRNLNCGTGVIRSDYFVEQAHGGQPMFSYGRIGLCDCKSTITFSDGQTPDDLFHIPAKQKEASE